MCYLPTLVLKVVERRNVLASYLGVGGCRKEKCVSFLPTCRCVWVSGGEIC